MDVVQKRNIRKQIEKETERFLKAGKKYRFCRLRSGRIFLNGIAEMAGTGMQWQVWGIYSGIDGEMSDMVFGAGEKHPWKGTD